MVVQVGNLHSRKTRCTFVFMLRLGANRAKVYITTHRASKLNPKVTTKSA